VKTANAELSHVSARNQKASGQGSSNFARPTLRAVLGAKNGSRARRSVCSSVCESMARSGRERAFTIFVKSDVSMSSW
jgi:hypothetical protein